MLAGSELNNKCLVQVERLSLHFPMANQHGRSLKLYLEPNGYCFLFTAFRHTPIYIALNGRTTHLERKSMEHLHARGV